MKKLFRNMALFTALVLIFAGCPTTTDDGGGGGTTDKFTVTFNLNGISGTPPVSQTIDKGGKATRPASNPTAAGYTFVNWYSTQVATPVPTTATPYDFDTPVTGNLTLYAGWNTDTANYWYVKFYNGTAVFHEEAINKTAASPSVNKPSPDPTKTGSTFKGWSETSGGTTAVTFPVTISADKNFYAIWESNDAEGVLDLSDIIKIGQGRGTYQGTTEWFLDLTTAPSGKSAIKMSPDTLASGENLKSYRMGFDFSAAVDIKSYGYIEFDLETDGGNPVGTTVLSVFIYAENDAGEPKPDKKMYFGASGVGTLRYTFNEDLWYSSYQLTGIEYYTPAINDSTNLYITRVQLGGTAKPEPVLGDEVAATNAFLTFTKGATSGTQSLGINDPANDMTGKSGYQIFYVYFDPLGQNFSAMEIVLDRPANGGNFSLNTVIDKNGEIEPKDGFNTYIDWMGYAKPPKWKGDPGTPWPSVDKASLKCVSFEIERGATNTNPADVLNLVSVTFYKSAAALDSIAVTTPPTKLTYAVGNTFDKTGLKVTATYTAGGDTADVTNSVTLTMGSTSLDSYVFVAGDVGNDKPVTVSYTDGEITKTATFNITVQSAALVLDSITVTPPTKLAYTVDQTFSKDGLNVIANYQGGSTADVTSSAVLTMGSTPLESYQFVAGDVGNDKPVTVSYTEGGVTKTGTFNITVSAKTAGLYLFENGVWAGGVSPTITGGSVVGNNIEVTAVTEGDKIVYRLDFSGFSVNFSTYTKLVVSFDGADRFFNYTVRTTDTFSISYISNSTWGTSASPHTVLLAEDGGNWQNWGKKPSETNLICSGMEIYSENPQAAAVGNVLKITSIKFE